MRSFLKVRELLEVLNFRRLMTRPRLEKRAMRVLVPPISIAKYIA